MNKRERRNCCNGSRNCFIVECGQGISKNGREVDENSLGDSVKSTLATGHTVGGGYGNNADVV